MEPILRGIDAPKVLVGGELLVDREFSERAEKDAQRAELISLPIALIVMAIVFGGVVAAGLPLAIAFGGVFATMVALGAVASVTDVSLYALNVVMMLGIGLGIDYGLLMVSRFREERGAGFDVPDAVRRTMATSGRTVVFSAAPSRPRLSSLFVFQDATMRSLGIAGITVVLACMVAALTLLPALLGRFGHRLGVATKAVGPRLLRPGRPPHQPPRRASSSCSCRSAAPARGPVPQRSVRQPRRARRSRSRPRRARSPRQSTNASPA